MKNQSAFPIVGEFLSTEYGLTKLEYFAGLAMQGLIAGSYSNINDEEKVAKLAIKTAKELIKQLDNDI